MIIDQLPALASPQDTDEIPIERGQLTYKIPWSNLAGGDIATLKADLAAAEADIDDLQSDMTTAQAAISQNTQFSKWVTFTAAGTQTISDSRFTADYILADYQFFSGTTATSDVLADMTVETGTGVATITITTVYSNGTVRLDFAYSEGSGTQS